jgi:hypothetical protein
MVRMVEQYQAEGELVKEPPFHAIASLLGPLILTSIAGTIASDLSATPLDPADHVRRFLQGRAVP